MVFINKDGLEKIICTSRKPNAIELAKQLGYKIITTVKEQETILILKESFKHINCKTQCQVGKYRIDLYIADYNLAIECDEYNHKHNSSNYEEQRESYIKRKLNCDFIRYNPDEENFNIGKVINKILIYINKHQ